MVFLNCINARFPREILYVKPDERLMAVNTLSELPDAYRRIQSGFFAERSRSDVDTPVFVQDCAP